MAQHGLTLVPVDYDPFAEEAPPASGFTLVPVDYDPFADEVPATDEFSPVERIGQETLEFGKGIPPGAVTLFGTTAKGVAGRTTGGHKVRQYIDELGTFTPGDLNQVIELRDRVKADENLTPLDKRAFQAGISDVVSGKVSINELKELFPLVTESKLFKAGEAIHEFGRELLPARPGFEQSVGRQLGEGAGTLVAGAAVSFLGGPIAAGTLFTFSGAGEAVDRAIQAGATEEQIIRAARLGQIPGVTDAAPIEVLLGRIPIPGAKLIKIPLNLLGKAMKVVGRIGLQAFVEGFQEGGQEFLQNMIAQEVHTPDQDLLEGIAPAAGIGAGVGAIADVGRQLITGFAGRRGRRPIPPGEVEKSAAVPPPVTPADEVSPIPTDIIAEGRAAVAGAEATSTANDILRRNGLPAVGARVTVTLPGGGIVTGEVVDAFTETNAELGLAEDGIKIALDDGGVFEEFVTDLAERGIVIAPEVVVEAAPLAAAPTPPARVVEEPAPAAVAPPVAPAPAAAAPAAPAPTAESLKARIEGAKPPEVAAAPGEPIPVRTGFLPNDVFNGDMEEALSRRFFAEGAPADMTVPLPNTGFRSDEIASLEEAGLATDGRMDRRQFNAWMDERGNRLAASVERGKRRREREKEAPDDDLQRGQPLRGAVEEGQEPGVVADEGGRREEAQAGRIFREPGQVERGPGVAAVEGPAPGPAEQPLRDRDLARAGEPAPLEGAPDVAAVAADLVGDPRIAQTLGDLVQAEGAAQREAPPTPTTEPTTPQAPRPTERASNKMSFAAEAKHLARNTGLRPNVAAQWMRHIGIDSVPQLMHRWPDLSHAQAMTRAGQEIEDFILAGPSTEPTAQGEQAVIPGAERITQDLVEQSRLRQLQGKRYKSAGDEKSIALIQRRLKADPKKWKAGQGVGRRIGKQINRGFRIVEVDPETKTAVIRQVADTGITTTGGDSDRIADERVHIADLIRDKKYDAPGRGQKNLFSLGRPRKQLFSLRRGPSEGGKPSTVYFSPTAEAIADAKFNKGTAEQWLALQGLKKEEIAFTGLDEFLRSQTGSITKADILDYLERNQVRVQEVVKGRELPAGQARAELANEPKFSNYTLPYGENYKELLITLPERPASGDALDTALQLAEDSGEVWGDLGPNGRQRFIDEARRLLFRDASNFTGGHFDEPNVLVHVRFNERVDAEGKRILFIEEMQSDWHAKGRKQGYRTAEERSQGYATAEAQQLAEREGLALGVPDAPFKKTWHELGLKRMIRWAAENDFDAVAWTTGAQQAERYDLSKQVDTVDVIKHVDGGRFVDVRKDGNSILDMRYDDKGIITDGRQEFIGKPLSDVLGKELADKVLAAPDMTAGRPARVTSLPSSIGPIIDRSEPAGQQWAIILSNQANARPLYGRHPTRAAAIAEAIEKINQAQQSGISANLVKRFVGLDLRIGGEGMAAFYDRMLPQAANRIGKKFGAKVGTTRIRRALNFKEVHTFPITPALKAAVLKDGLPLFSLNRLAELTPTADPSAPEILLPPVTDVTTPPPVTPATPVNPRFAGDVGRIGADLQARLSKLGIADKVALRVVEDLQAVAGGRAILAFGRFTVRHKFITTKGHLGEERITKVSLTPGLIEVSLAAQDGQWVLDHEVIHALRAYELIRDAEWTTLTKAATADTERMARMRDQRKGQGLTEDQIVEEVIADMFADWSVGRTQAGGFLRRAFERIRDFLTAFGRALTQRGYASMNDIFGTVESGEVGRRDTVNDTGPIGMSQAFMDESDSTKLPPAPKLSSRVRLDDLLQKWRDRGLRLSVHETDERIKLNDIVVPAEQRKQGLGSAFMGELTTYADQIGKRIELSVAQRDDRLGTTSRPRLVKFYKRFGFVENKGRNKDFSLSAGMYRLPRTAPKLSQGRQVSPPTTFDNADTEARWQDARKGAASQETLATRAKARMLQFGQGFTRHYRHLPNKPEFAEVGQQFRIFEAAPKASMEQIVRILRQITDGMSRKDLDLFTRKIVLDDLSFEADEEHDLPFAMTPADVARELAKVDRALENRPELQAKVRQRKLIARGIANRLVEAKILHREQIKNPAYYRHQVLDYARATVAEAKKPRSERASGAIHSPQWAKRLGSSKDINANFLEAEYEWLYKALTGIAEAKAIDWVDKSDHNVRADAIAAAQGSNASGVRARLAKDMKDNNYFVREDRETGEQIFSSPLNDEWKAFRQRIAIGFGKIRKALESEAGAGMIIPPEFRAQATRLLNTEEENFDDFDEGSPFPFLAWMMDTDQPSASGAAMTFKAIANRIQWTKDLLGKKYIATRDMEGLVKRGFAPEGFAAWQPDTGKMLFVSKTIPEHVMDRMIAKLAEVPAGGNISAEALKEAIDSVRPMLAVGGPKYQMILPQEIVDTLNSIRDPHAESLILTAIRWPSRQWKRWVLINPRRVIKYNINNLSGDLDAVIAGNPRALKKLPQAIRELWAVSIKGGAPSVRFREATEFGVIDSGFAIQEIPDISFQSEFEHLIREPASLKRPDRFVANKIRGIWRALQRYTWFRENWLRYAAYLDYVERHEAGESMSSIGYGAAKRAMLDAISDPKMKAAYQARELIGDYGAISAAGQEIRETIIPFYSWMEINTKRYWRLGINAGSQGVGEGFRTAGIIGAGLGIRTTVYLGVRMALLYGMVQLWNNLVFGDEEDELSADDRVRLHLNLGRGLDGEIKLLRFQGAFSDFLGWIGFENAVQAMLEVEKGRGTWGEVLDEVKKAPVNRIVNGITPLLSMPTDLLRGRASWPDVTHPRPIRDKWRHVAKLFSVEHEYDQIFDRPTRGFGRSLIQGIISSRDVGENAYGRIRGMAFDFNRRRLGSEGSSSFNTERSRALHTWRLAKRFGDASAAKKARRKLTELGVSDEDLKRSIKRAHPLGGIPIKHWGRFRRSLTARERKSLALANRWYRETYLQP